MLEESEEPHLSSNSDPESQQNEKNNEKNSSKNSVETLEESKVIRKAKDRVLPGFETSRDKSKWKSSFFFVQAADTQLGMIDTWGGKDTVGAEYPNISWDREIELCSQTVDLLNQYGFISNLVKKSELEFTPCRNQLFKTDLMSNLLEYHSNFKGINSNLLAQESS